MTNTLVLRYAAAALVLPAIAVVYALWHEGVVTDGALMVWMLLPIAGTIFAVGSLKSGRIADERLRRGFWSMLVAQGVGLTLGLYSAAMLREAVPLWAVAGVSLLMLIAWAWFAVAMTGTRRANA